MKDDTTKLGMGVILGQLSDGNETSRAVSASLGKTISGITADDNSVRIVFTDGSSLSLFDDGQSCCEKRYMVCPDRLAEWDGSKLVGVTVADAPDIDDVGSDTHQVQFLNISTDRGLIQFANHNEHNGYYGGFWIKATYTEEL